MKILICIGSYRKRGNTARITEMVAEQLQKLAAYGDEPLEVEKLFLAHEDIKGCRGCRVCFDKGETRCPLEDDLSEVKAKMLAADGLIIASPVYVNDVNGAIKNWIDRLAYICHRPEFSGKCAYVVATVGNGPTNHALRTMSMALNFWGYYVVGQSGFKTGAFMDREEMVSCYEPGTKRVAEELFQAVRERRPSKPSFLSLMTFRIQQRYWQRNKEESIDSAFWEDRGWTEPRSEYYISPRASRLKVSAARLAGTILARYVT
jgi:multimeric flavodoxin WrbA